MAETWAFSPLYVNTGNAGSPAGSFVSSVTIAATASSQVGLLPGGASSSAQIEFCNQSSSWAYINLGIAGAVATATVIAGYPIGPGADKVITVATECTGWSVILATGTGSVTATRGSGT